MNSNSKTNKSFDETTCDQLIRRKREIIAMLKNYMGWSASSIWSKFKINASQLNQILSKVKKEGEKLKRNIKAISKYKQSQYERS